MSSEIQKSVDNFGTQDGLEMYKKERHAMWRRCIFVMTDGCNATCFASASIRVSSSFKYVCVYKKNWSSKKLRLDKGRRI